MAPTLKILEKKSLLCLSFALSSLQRERGNVKWVRTTDDGWKIRAIFSLLFFLSFLFHSAEGKKFIYSMDFILKGGEDWKVFEPRLRRPWSIGLRLVIVMATAFWGWFQRETLSISFITLISKCVRYKNRRLISERRKKRERNLFFSSVLREMEAKSILN